MFRAYDFGTFSNFLILLLTSTFSSVASVCIEDDSLLTKTTIGYKAEIKDYPFQVSIMYQKEAFCIGALISGNFVVTTASCCHFDSKRMTVRAGTVYYQKKGCKREVSEKFVHPQSGHSPIYDICLLKLKKPFVYSSKINRVTLPCSNDYVPDEGKIVVTLGWGFSWPMKKELTKKDKLHYLNVPILKMKECKISCRPDLAIEKSRSSTGNKPLICTGTGAYGLEPCERNKGSPLLINGTLIGLFSEGNGECYAKHTVFGPHENNEFEESSDNNEFEESTETNEFKEIIDTNSSTDPPIRCSKLVIRKRKKSVYTSIIVNREFIKKITDI